MPRSCDGTSDFGRDVIRIGLRVIPKFEAGHIITKTLFQTLKVLKLIARSPNSFFFGGGGGNWIYEIKKKSHNQL